jgi:ferric-dicitrate binding protein FerR (iron transport regulator)
MSKQNDPEDLDEGGIEQLLRQVGGRSEPSPEVTNEVRDAVHAQWQVVVRARKRQQRVIAFAMAAGVACVALVTLFTLRSVSPQSVQVATVTRIDGRLQIAGDSTRDASIGDRLSTGETVRTDGQTHAALNFRGLSVRVDAGSTFKVAAADRLVLDAGALYIDAAPAAKGPVALDVETLAGSVRHLGTQYQVRALDDAVIVSVREGRVEISGAHGTNVGEAGEQLRLSSSGDVQRSQIGATDASWKWAADAAPLFQIADQPLSAFLNWVARETGRKLVYQNPQAQALADSVRLRGSIEGLDADTAMAAVLPTTSLRRHATQDDSIVIGLADANESHRLPASNP